MHFADAHAISVVFYFATLIFLFLLDYKVRGWLLSHSIINPPPHLSLSSLFISIDRDEK
jgi:hypothetical protein